MLVLYEQDCPNRPEIGPSPTSKHLKSDKCRPGSVKNGQVIPSLGRSTQENFQIPNICGLICIRTRK